MLACQIMAQPAAGQTFTRGGQLLVAAEPGNTAASQVAVAQGRLFGSMLVSYRVNSRALGAPAALTIATRSERQILEVHPETYAVRLVSRHATRRALPPGVLLCRSYAPIDAIVRLARSRYPDAVVEVLPPHRPGLPWLAKVGSKTHRIGFDRKGRAYFPAQTPAR
jgi:hypothetical protein